MVFVVFNVKLSLLYLPFLKACDILRVHWPSSKDKARILRGVPSLPLPLQFDHCHVLGRLNVLGVEVPLLELSLILLLAEERPVRRDGRGGGKEKEGDRESHVALNPCCVCIVAITSLSFRAWVW